MRVGWKPKSVDDTIASVRFRCLTPMQWLHDNGFSVEIFDPSAAMDYDVLVFSKLYGPDDQRLAHSRRAAGKASVLDLSDNHFYNPLGHPAYEAAAENIRAMVQLVDSVVCCSRYLTSVVRSECLNAPTCFVVGDAVESLPIHRRAVSVPHKGPHLLWFGSHGSPNAQGGLEDLSLLEDRLGGMKLPSEIRLSVISNNREKFEQIAPSLPLSAVYFDWTPEKFGELLSVADAVVLPIRSNPFTLSKSENRVTTPLWYGVPVISDLIPSYEKLSGFAYIDDWQQGLCDLMTQPDRVDQRTNSGQRIVRALFNEERIARSWWRVFEQTTAAKKAYLCTKADTNALHDIPISGRLYGRSEQELKARLCTERSLMSNMQPSLVVVYGLDAPADVRFAKRLRALIHHSASPKKVFLFVPQKNAEATERWAQSAAPKELNVTVFSSEDQLKSACGIFNWVVFLHQSEWLDTSVANAVRRLGKIDSIIVWARAQLTDPNRPTIIRTPDPFSFEHLQAPTFGNSFAVPGYWCKQYPGDLGAELLDLRLHIFSLWLRANGVSATYHDEVLQYSDTEILFLAEAADRGRYYDAYDTILTDILDGTSINVEQYEHQPTLIPKGSAPDGVSIIIPYRNRSTDTLRAVRSVLNSRTSQIPLEFVLVDNQSDPDEFASIVAEVETLQATDIFIQNIRYDSAFNHSAQINLGANEARFEMLVFMNNDVYVETPGTIEAVSHWASSAHASTVGIRLLNPVTGAVSDGFHVRQRRVRLDDSPVQESSDLTSEVNVREVFGNTFAFACIRRDAFLTLGMADERAFPIGYNDVAFACEGKLRKLKAYCLLDYHGTHAPGQSRGKTDESFEKAAIRQRYFDVLAESKSGLTVEASKELKSPFAEQQPLPTVLSTPAPTRSKLQRLVSRLFAQPVIQDLLKNPIVYKIVRKGYRLFLRPVLRRS